MSQYTINIDDEQTDPTLVQTRAMIGRSINYEVQTTLQQYADVGLGAQTGVVGSPTLIAAIGLESPQNTRQVAGGSGYVGDNGGYFPNPGGCPEVNEYVWIDDFKRIKVKSLINRECSLYNPVTRNFNKLISAKLLEDQPLFEIQTERGFKSVVSQTDKVITSVYDKIGRSLINYRSGQIISFGSAKLYGRNHYNIYTDSFYVKNTGIGDVVVISLESEFIYVSGSDKFSGTLRHNRKDLPGGDQFQGPNEF